MNNYILLCLALSSLLCVQSKAQDVAGSVNPSYSNIGANSSVGIMYVRNTGINPMQFHMLAPICFSTGLSYHVSRNNLLSHKFHLNYLTWWMGYGFGGTKQGAPYWREQREAPYGFINIGYNTIITYNIPKKTSLSFYGGPVISINRFGRDFGQTFIEDMHANGHVNINHLEIWSTEFPVYIGADAGISTNINLNFLRIEIFCTYHYQFESSIYRTVASTSIQGLGDYVTYHELLGNNMQVGLSLYIPMRYVNRILEKY
jgi:hypothetical protein